MTANWKVQYSNNVKVYYEKTPNQFVLIDPAISYEVSGSTDYNIRIEGLSQSEARNDAYVKAYVFAPHSFLNPITTKVADTVKLSVIPRPVVHPIDSDYAAGHAGRVMLRTWDDAEADRPAGSARYYLTENTTISDAPAQTEDGLIKATVQFQGIHPSVEHGIRC